MEEKVYAVYWIHDESLILNSTSKKKSTITEAVKVLNQWSNRLNN